MERLTTADRRTLAYRRMGEGPVLVCHPGGPGFSSRYLADLGGLGEELELVLLDPRGTGGSDPALGPHGYAIDDYASDLEEVRRHLGLERMFLFGHSHGGVAAIAYAARHPERVERLILAGTLPRQGPEQRAATQAALEKRAAEPWYEDAVKALETEEDAGFTDGRELMSLVLRMMPLYFARYDAAERAHVQSMADEELCVDATRLWEQAIFERFDQRPLLPRLTMPTLVITGSEDFVTDPQVATEDFATIPAAQIHVVEGAGHMLFVEAPEAFRTAVLSFLGVGAPA
jgi:proline-specific peptidase